MCCICNICFSRSDRSYHRTFKYIGNWINHSINSRLTAFSLLGYTYLIFRSSHHAITPSSRWSTFASFVSSRSLLDYSLYPPITLRSNIRFVFPWCGQVFYLDWLFLTWNMMFSAHQKQHNPSSCKDTFYKSDCLFRLLFLGLGICGQNLFYFKICIIRLYNARATIRITPSHIER